MVTLLYFASLRESLGCSREQMALPSGNSTVSSLVDVLRNRDGRFPEAFAPGKILRVALNQQMDDLATPVKPGEEVSFFPTVTGG